MCTLNKKNPSQRTPMHAKFARGVFDTVLDHAAAVSHGAARARDARVRELKGYVREL